jgi:uncharacterized protein YlzI (FlbEa/FlbD family)
MTFSEKGGKIKMISFTDEYDKKVYVNPKLVTAISSSGHFTIICLTGVQFMNVKESIEEVVSRVNREF